MSTGQKTRLIVLVASVSLILAEASFAFSSRALAQSALSQPAVTEKKLQLFDWRQTAVLEHEDRKKRFQRLAAQGLIASPSFYEALISKKDLRAFGVDLPVLRVVFPQRVFFDTDKSDLRPEALQVIDLVAEDLRKDVPDVAVFVAGHTDFRGSDEYNYVLSVERADAVARALFARGVGSSNLWRVGFGKAVPLKPNTTAQNMAENRRVEFLFAARPEAVAVWLAKQAVNTCDGLSQEMRQRCRKKIAALPLFTATPVLTEKRTPISGLKTTKSVPGEKSNKVKTGSTEQQTAVNGMQQRAPALIEKNSTVIINLTEQRVTVGEPVL